MSVVVLVSGPSAAGKGSVIQGALQARAGGGSKVKNALQNFPSLWQLGRTLTTRPPRDDDVMYDYASESDFHAAFFRDELLEQNKHFGAWYGKRMPSNEGCWLLELDVEGAATARERIPHAFTVFIDAPSDAVLRQRLRARELKLAPEKRLTPEKFEERIERAEFERIFAREHGIDHLIINDDLKVAVDDLASFLFSVALVPPNPAEVRAS